MKLKDCLFGLLAILAIVAVWDVTVGDIFLSLGNGVKAGGQATLDGIHNKRVVPRR